MDKDEFIDRILTRTLRSEKPAGTPEGCLDAETLAAWSDGALQPHERAAAEAHAADCSRCLAVLAAMALTTPAAVEVPWWRGMLSLRWVGTAAALATALGLWIAVDPRFDRRGPEEVPKAAADAATPAAPTQEAVPRPTIPPERKEATSQPALEKRAEPAMPPPAVAADATAERRRDAAAAKADEASGMRQPVAAPAAPAPVSAEALKELRRQNSLGVAATFEIPSAEPTVRWRLADGSVERSTDGGRTWEVQSIEARAALLAGASPSATVCWLVGKGGTVLLTTDGRLWRRVTSPSSADVIGITPIDGATATVRTADGATYRTTDGGATWVLQETPATSF